MNKLDKGDLIHIPAEVYLFQSRPIRESPFFNENWKITRKTREPQLGIFLKYANEKSAVVVLNDGEWVVDKRYIYPAEMSDVNRVSRNKVELSKQL
tara:strand:- start:191 stop:478 length:288 start_codon:yes stop_codon:yes gene_type:complete